ncbi:hypothetical protein MFIFM68171_10250 [Madurella fahalii]|uniref:Uncharacterized protein n=1 Tax=Madurella fahalii TaxID=1157608 RepID=A0ABQ0GQL3_9PEZI
MAKSTLLREHVDALDDILAWLAIEIHWWTGFENRSRDALEVDCVDTSRFNDVYRFEKILDAVAKGATERRGQRGEA